jgi:hypothetical protein
MSFVRVIAGDFRSGRVEFDGIGFALRTPSGRSEYIDFVEVRDIQTLERENRSSVTDGLAGLAAGGIVGGIAAGAMAGGLTGPAGAVIGAAAGAVLAATRKFLTCQVLLRDGRRFVATGKSETWAAIRSCAHDAARVNKPTIVESAPSPSSSTTLLVRLKDHLSLSRLFKWRA